MSDVAAAIEAERPNARILLRGAGNGSGAPSADRCSSTSTAGSPPLLTGDAFLAGFKPPEYVVDGIIQARRVYSCTGCTGHGKTAIALLLAACVATGRPFGGAATTPGSVLYLAAENADDVRMRWTAVRHHMALPVDVPVFFVDRPFSLADHGEALAEAAAPYGSFQLVIIDTGPSLFAAGGGENDNDNIPMLEFAQDAREFGKRLPGWPAVVPLMHPVKNATRDNLLPRGGGAFLAEIDGNLTVWLAEDRRTVTLHWLGKIRGPDFTPRSFQLYCATAPSLVDSNGRALSTVLANAITETQAEVAEERIKGEAASVLRVMLKSPGAPLASIAVQLGWAVGPEKKPDKTKVQRLLKSLTSSGLVEQVLLGRYELTPKGKRLAGKIDDA